MLNICKKSIFNYLPTNCSFTCVYIFEHWHVHFWILNQRKDLDFIQLQWKINLAIILLS